MVCHPIPLKRFSSRKKVVCAVLLKRTALWEYVTAFTQGNDLPWNSGNSILYLRCYETPERIADCKEHVNMVCLRYAQSENHPCNGTRQTGDCCHQSILWAHFRQRGYPICLEQGTERNTAAIHSTQALIRNAAFIPMDKSQGLSAAAIGK
jgi:hypothetical protein